MLRDARIQSAEPCADKCADKCTRVLVVTADAVLGKAADEEVTARARYHRDSGEDGECAEFCGGEIHQGAEAQSEMAIAGPTS